MQLEHNNNDQSSYTFPMFSEIFFKYLRCGWLKVGFINSQFAQGLCFLHARHKTTQVWNKWKWNCFWEISRRSSVSLGDKYHFIEDARFNSHLLYLIGWYLILLSDQWRNKNAPLLFEGLLSSFHFEYKIFCTHYNKLENIPSLNDTLIEETLLIWFLLGTYHLLTMFAGVHKKYMLQTKRYLRTRWRRFIEVNWSILKPCSTKANDFLTY